VFQDVFDADKAPLTVAAKSSETKGIPIALTPYEVEIYAITWEAD
jgi:hypothetical protein